MTADAGPFEAFYYSQAQHPVLLWLAVAAAAVAVLARRDLAPSLRRYALALAALSALDAWLTSSPLPGLGELPAALAKVVPTLFVLAGDFRYWLLVTAGTADGALAPRLLPVLEALGLTLVVPLLAQLSRADGRALYLVYEGALLLLAAAVVRWHPAARELRWIRRLSYFVMFYYGLWAAADALLLATGADVGFALRVIPNLLYYGGLIAAIAWLAPAQRWRTRRDGQGAAAVAVASPTGVEPGSPP